MRVFGGLSRIVTNASAGTFVGDGKTLSDVATVLDRVNPDGTGIVDFRLYGPNDTACSGTPIFETLGVAYPASGGSVTSGQFAPTQAGIYRWVASYRGDGNNSGAVGECGDLAETVTVAPTPDIDTELPATGSGGVGGSEGSAHMTLEGDEDKIEQVMELVKSLKDEPPVTMPDGYKITDPAEYDYDAQAQLDTLGGL